MRLINCIKFIRYFKLIHKYTVLKTIFLLHHNYDIDTEVQNCMRYRCWQLLEYDKVNKTNY